MFSSRSKRGRNRRSRSIPNRRLPPIGRRPSYERLEARRLLAITTAHDPSIVGNGSAPSDGFNLTVDSDTGFEWLDLTISTGFTFDEVQAELGAGGLFEGFRFATAPEIATYWQNAGVIVPNRFQLEDPAANPLIRTWGVTYDPAFLDHSMAYYDETGVSADPDLFGVAFLSSNTRGREQAEFRADSSNTVQAGSALIRGGPGDPHPIGTIQGTKFHDLDGDGYQDAGEPGLEAWTIYLDENDNGVLDAGEVSTTTDANGDYEFAGLDAPADYIVREVHRPGWEQTAPQTRSDGDGQLTFVDVVDDSSLFKVQEVIVSHDSRHVYAIADSAITVFQRAVSTGDLVAVEVLRDYVRYCARFPARFRGFRPSVISLQLRYCYS